MHNRPTKSPLPKKKYPGTGGWGLKIENSIAYRQGTPKGEGAQSVNQSIRHKVIQKPPNPVQTPK